MSTDKKTTAIKGEIHDETYPLLRAMYNEFKDLSKKKPDGAVSKNKIKVVNRLLTKCREVLKDEVSIEYLDLLDEDEVPQTSDVVIMLSQYVTVMDRFRITYYVYVSKVHKNIWLK